MKILTPNFYPMLEKFLEQIKLFISILAAVGLLSATGNTLAQSGSLTGSIIDGETGEGLIGANILLEGTTIGAASDIEGNYRIQNVPVGTYTLVASMIGYTKITVTGVEVKTDEQIRLDLTLNSEAFETDEVVVTARNDTYPITRYLHFFTAKVPTGAVKDFINWVLSPDGQQIVDQSGFISLWEFHR